MSTSETPAGLDPATPGEPPKPAEASKPEPAASPEPKAGEGTDWHAKFKKADQRNVELSGSLRETREALEAAQKQIENLTTTVEETQSTAAEAAERAKGLLGEKNQRQFTDAVLEKVSPPLQGEAALMVRGLMATEYQVNHETPTDDVANMAASAVEKLRQQAPRLFSDHPRIPGDASKPDLSGYKSWFDVPTHLRESASNEDFARLTGQAGRIRRLSDIGS